MKTKITKKDAEFIKKTATKIIKDDTYDLITIWLPRYYKMTEVMINCNVVTGKFNGEWIEYDPEFTDEATEILGIY